MKIREYRKGDAFNGYMAKEPLVCNKFLDETAILNNPGWTILDNNDNIIASGGAIQLWPGVGEIWMLVRRDLKDYRISFVKTAKFKHRELVERYGMLRLQAIVNVNFAEGITMARMFGFRCEGYLHCFLPDGSDALLFASIGV